MINKDFFHRFLKKLLSSIVIFSVVVSWTGYGVVVGSLKIPPYQYFLDAILGINQILVQTGVKSPWYYIEDSPATDVITYKPEVAPQGLTLISLMGNDDSIKARVIAPDGEIIHQWDIDWFKLWGDVTHLPQDLVPKSRPGTHIHGIEILDNGDIVFNFDGIGLIRLDVCGKTVWRLPYQTHHSVHQAEDGTLWVAGKVVREESSSKLPNYKPPYQDYTVLQVSGDGEILKEWSIFEIIRNSYLKGLLYLATTNNSSTEISGDTMHLNDVEPFPLSMTPGVFRHGDVMVSLRNINAVLIFDSNTNIIRHMFIGSFVRQHDPDFVDGNTISVYDNNNVGNDESGVQSQIIEVFAPTGKKRVVYSGTSKQPFFSNIMGKHQLLSNGHILITESKKGRVFEVDESGELVWEYYNIVTPELLGAVEQAERLSPLFTPAFFAERQASCH